MTGYAKRRERKSGEAGGGARPCAKYAAKPAVCPVWYSFAWQNAAMPARRNYDARVGRKQARARTTPRVTIKCHKNAAATSHHHQWFNGIKHHAYENSCPASHAHAMAAGRQQLQNKQVMSHATAFQPVRANAQNHGSFCFTYIERLRIDKAERPPEYTSNMPVGRSSCRLKWCCW